jgi:DNA-binding transcriptional LysR family regulator
VNRTIAVSCAPTLASRWLLPRLHRFSARRRDVSVTVNTSQRQIGFPADGFDFALRMSRAPAAGAAWTRLFGERLVPVCSPAYRDGLVDASGAVDLGRATLIHVTPASEDWRAWLERKRLGEIDIGGGLRFDTIQMAFEAAAMGLGVVLGRRPLVDPDLESGALVALEPEAMIAETAYWLVSSEGAGHRPELRGFKRWLITEAEAFVAAC